ncbi:MAG: hypothetical protein GY807_21790 [Gammaproteobacteria bacterium]|nr:hypothetical protein [Gammaproteobacteria bacterium]
MQYDLELLTEICGEIGFPVLPSPENSLRIDLGSSVSLEFVNWPDKGDCLLGFPDTAWHTHGDLLRVTRDYHERSFHQLDVITGLASGKLLICEKWSNGTIEDRELVLPDFDVSEEFEFSQKIEIRVRRASANSQ